MAFNSEDIFISRFTANFTKLKNVPAPTTIASEGAIFVSDGSGGLSANDLYYQGESNTTPVNLTPTGGFITATNPLLSVQNRLNVKKNPGLGEFATIEAAIVSIGASSGPNNRFIISVGPGIYLENPLIVPTYVFIVGMDIDAVVIRPINTAVPLFSLRNLTGISFLSIEGSNTVGFIAISCIDTGDFVLLHKVSIYTSYVGISCIGTVAGSNYVYLEYIDVDDSFLYSTIGQTTPPAILDIFAEDYFIISTTIVPTIGVLVDGEGTIFDTNGANMTGLPATPGICTQTQNGAAIHLQSTSIQDWATGIYNPNTGSGSNIQISNTSFNNVDVNLDIQNPATTGYGDGFTEYARTNISNSQFFITNRPRQIINVATTGGDYTSIAAAVASIGVLTPVASAAYPYTILLAPGTYNLAASLTLPSFVEIRGTTATTSRIVGAVSPTIIGSPNSSMTLVTVSCPTGTAVQYTGSATPGAFQLFNVVFGPCLEYANLSNSSGTSHVFIGLSSCTTDFLTTRGITVQNCSLTMIASYFNVVGGSIDHLMNFSGAGALPNIINSGFTVVSGGPNGVGLYIANSATVIAQNCTFNNLSTGILNPSDATAPFIRLIGLLFNNCTTNINLQNANTFGSINLISDLAKTSINPAITNLSTFIQDPTSNNASVTFDGRFIFGRTINQITDMTSSLLDTSVVGLVSGGALTNPAGLQVSAASGTGYLIKTGPPNYFTYITWGNLGPITVPAQGTSYIYIDNNGALASSLSLPDPISTILLGSVVAVAATIILIESVPQIGNQLASRIDTQLLKQGLGPIYNSGSLVVVNGTVQLDVSNGVYFYGANGRFAPVGANPITFSLIFSVGSTSNVQLSATTSNVPLNNYNDITTGIVAMGAGQYTAHALYCYTDGVTTSYILRYGQAQFATQQLAEGYVVASGMDLGIPIIATIIVQQGTAAITSIIDRRPYISAALAGSTPTITAHSALSGLTVGNDHPQYFRVDGTSPMAADIDNGNFAIINNLTVNGVTVQAHAARHLPGGPDALTTAAPVTIGTANSIGVAASFARSDHVHAHGAQTDPTLHAVVSALANGFMSTTDKSKLDASTATNTASTLVQRTAGGQFDARSIRYMDNTNTNAVTIVAPATFAPAWQLTLPTTTGSNGQILTTDGTGVTSWTTNSGFIDPMTTAYDMIYRNGANTTARLPVGTIGQTLRAINTTFSAVSQPPAVLTYARPLDARIETRFFDDCGGGGTGAAAFDNVWTITSAGSGTITPISIPSVSTTTMTSTGWVQFSSESNNSYISANRGIGSMTLLNNIIEFEAEFAIGALNSAIESSTARVGFGNQKVATTAPTNGFWFEISGFPTTFICRSVANGSLTSVSVPLAALTTPAINTWYRIRIVSNYNATQLQFFLQSRGAVTLTNTLVGTINTNIPNVSTTVFGPAVQVINVLGNASSHAFLLDYFYYTQKYVNLGRSEFT